MEWIQNVDWKFVIGDILMPVLIFFAGCFVGGHVERRENNAKAKVNGNGNSVIQNSSIQK